MTTLPTYNLPLLAILNIYTYYTHTCINTEFHIYIYISD
jgi:hypothetical protein